MKASISVGDVIECCDLYHSSQDPRIKELGIVVGIIGYGRKLQNELSKDLEEKRANWQKQNKKITIYEVLMFNSGQIQVRTDEHYKFWRVWD